jgi:hypothetical protein
MAVVRSRHHVLSQAPCLGWKEWLDRGQDLISFLSLSERGNRAAHRNIRPSFDSCLNVSRQEDKVPLMIDQYPHPSNWDLTGLGMPTLLQS